VLKAGGRLSIGGAGAGLVDLTQELEQLEI